MAFAAHCACMLVSPRLPRIHNKDWNLLRKSSRPSSERGLEVGDEEQLTFIREGHLVSSRFTCFCMPQLSSQVSRQTSSSFAADKQPTASTPMMAHAEQNIQHPVSCRAKLATSVCTLHDAAASQAGRCMTWGFRVSGCTGSGAAWLAPVAAAAMAPAACPAAAATRCAAAAAAPAASRRRPTAAAHCCTRAPPPASRPARPPAAATPAAAARSGAPAGAGAATRSPAAQARAPLTWRPCRSRGPHARPAAGSGPGCAAWRRAQRPRRARCACRGSMRQGLIQTLGFRGPPGAPRNARSPPLCHQAPHLARGAALALAPTLALASALCRGRAAAGIRGSVRRRCRRAARCQRRACARASAWAAWAAHVATSWQA